MKITFIFFCTSHVARSFETMILAFLDHKLVTRPKQQNHRIQGCSYVLYSGLSSSYQNGRGADWGEPENLLVWKMQTGSKNYNSPEFCDFATLAVWWEDICIKACKWRKYHTTQAHLGTTWLSCLSNHENELRQNAVLWTPDCAKACSSCSSSSPPPPSRRPSRGSTSWSRGAPRQPP